jgi:hypothetical protein
MKLSQRVAVVGVPLALVGAALLLPGTTAQAGTDFDSVAITVQPTTTAVNTVMTPAVVVQVDKSPGIVDPAYHGTVTLSYAANPSNAPLPSGNTVTAVKGVATFSGLSFSAVGFNFELRATSNVGTTSPASAPFDIGTQVVNCSSGQSCQSGTVSSDGTSASAVAATGSISDVLVATAGGFPLLSCTSLGGVVSFSDQNRALVITMTLDKSLVQQANPDGASDFNICWGSLTPFTTKNGTTSAFNTATNEYEGLLPDCVTNGPEPCVAHRNKDNAGDEVITVDAPGGDPHITF